MADHDEQAEESGGEGAYALDPAAVERIVEAAGRADRDALLREIAPLHAADVADLLEQIDADDRRRVVEVYGWDFDGEVLSELDESLRGEIVEALGPAVVAEAVRGLASDDLVDLVEDLETEGRENVLGALDDSARAAVNSSLAHPEDSAGRLMQREVVAAPLNWTVGEAIDHLRARDDLPVHFYHITLVDPAFRPVANAALGRVLGTKREVPLMEVAEETFHTIPASQDGADVAYAFNQYHLISAPVVDESGRLAGVITIDDAMAVLDEEHEEDILRLAGVGEGSLADRLADTARSRLPWLAANLATALLASWVIAQFEEAIARLVALAVIMPIVASMGGNAGTQSLTVAVRSLATRDLTRSNLARFVRREALAGLVNGAVFAVLTGAASWAWFGDARLGLIVAAAMVINMVAAGLAGTLIPVLLEKAGVDPALASSVFVTTVTDVIGFLAFLGLAAAFLL